MITLRYKPKSINYNLIFGIIWLSLGIARVTLVQKDNFFFYGFIVFGICYLTMYFVMKYKQYATITDEVIKESEITINTNQITEDSVIEVKNYAQKLRTELNIA